MLLQDIRYAFRSLRRSPGFAAMGIIVLALGIGSNTTVFTLVNAVLFRGLPFENADRVMYLSSKRTDKAQPFRGVSYPDFEEWRAQNKSFEGLAAFNGGTMNLSDGTTAPQRYSGSRLTSNAFRLIGQAPLLGRDFLPEEDQPGAESVTILGYSIWANRYGSDPGILGRVVRINEVPTTIVGVMPEGMKFPQNADLWMPLIPEGELERREARNIEVFGRLREGVNLGMARQEFETLAENLAVAFPDSNRGFGVEIKTYNDQFNGGEIRVVFLALLGAVGFVLLIACANLANLQLSRTAGRMREMAIRTALGAGRARVIRQVLVECVLVSSLGGLLGLGLSVVGVRAFDVAVADVGKPYWIDFRMDYVVFCYFAAACVLSGILFGLVPALRASGQGVSQNLQDGSRGNSEGRGGARLSGALVVAQLSLAVVLLVGAGLMIRSLLNISTLDLGISTENLQTMRIGLAESKYPEEKRLQFEAELLERVAAIPGVAEAAVTTNLPINGGFQAAIELEGRPVAEPGERPREMLVAASPTYWDTLGIELQSGRVFTEQDGRPGSSVAVVNQRFATKYWPDQPAVGQRIRLIEEPTETEAPWVTIVGVSASVRQNSPQDVDIDPVVYLPYRQKPERFFSLVAKTHVKPETVVEPIRSAVQAIDPDLPVYFVQTMDEILQQSGWAFRVFGTLFSIFAVIALVLASVGLYAVISYSVSRRTQEIGVRMALGASSRKVLTLVLRRGLRQLAIGLGIGVALAFALSQVMTSLLINVKPWDPATFGLVSALLSTAAILASFIPARRASSIDPIRALRVD